MGRAHYAEDGGLRGFPRAKEEDDMSDSKTDFGGAYWSHSLSEVDKEVARLATICNVRLARSRRDRTRAGQ